jgi:D-arginine dehydrogenase
VRSAPFFHATPPGFAESPILRETGVLNLVAPASWRGIEAHAHTLSELGLDFRLLSVDEARAIVPALAPTELGGAIHVPRDGRIDVHEILSSYLRRARAAGAELHLGAEVEGFLIEAGRCRGVRTRDRELRARVVVDAAGAWAGRIAELAGASPILLAPLRRTIFTFPVPSGLEVRDWPARRQRLPQPLLRPGSGRPHDEPDGRGADGAVRSVARRRDDRRGDRAPDASRPALRPTTIKRRWSGLRTFSPDRVHVVGEDPTLPGFFWLAGQGGLRHRDQPDRRPDRGRSHRRRADERLRRAPARARSLRYRARRLGALTPERVVRT